MSTDSGQIFHGNILDGMQIPDGSVHCCVTSPPYWGLRDYGVDGQLGLESTPEAYIENMVKVFREVWRVLRDDGTLWLNLGDSYSAGGNGGHKTGVYFHGHTRRGGDMSGRRKSPPTGLKTKEIVGIPWRVAFALQADGWYLRQDIIWHKPNPMPESVKDRCTKAHEYIFLLSKNQRYYCDMDAIKEPAICGDPRRPYGPGQVDSRGNGHDRGGGKIRSSAAKGSFNGKTEAMANTGQNAFRAVTDFRNKRSVWTVPTKPFKEAHFATFPPDLIEPCILAGCPEGGTVFDPFLGSGTTAVVSHRYDRKFIGCDLSEKYLREIAIPRIKAETAQTKLFA